MDSTPPSTPPRGSSLPLTRLTPRSSSRASRQPPEVISHSTTSPTSPRWSLLSGQWSQLQDETHHPLSAAPTATILEYGFVQSNRSSDDPTTLVEEDMSVNLGEKWENEKKDEVPVMVQKNNVRRLSSRPAHLDFSNTPAHLRLDIPSPPSSSDDEKVQPPVAASTSTKKSSSIRPTLSLLFSLTST